MFENRREMKDDALCKQIHVEQGYRKVTCSNQLRGGYISGRRALVGSSRGTTLVELLVTLAVSMIILSASMQGLHLFQQKFLVQQRTMDQQQELRIGLQVLNAELRLTGGSRSKIGLSLIKVEKTDVAFLANLDRTATTLRHPILGTTVTFPVANGRGWKKGRQILICESTVCVKARLAANGVRNTLTVETPVGRRFPAGSQVLELRYVRYYLGKDRQGHPSVMRQVGGGVNSFISHVAHFEMKYFTPMGFPTRNPGDVSRVTVEIAVRDTKRMIRSGVGLRG